MNDKQNYLMIAGLVIIAGLTPIVSAGTSSAAPPTVSLRPRPLCAEQIQPLAVKCRYCGADVDPLQSLPKASSVEGLSPDDLKNLAEFYAIGEQNGEYEYQS